MKNLLLASVFIAFPFPVFGYEMVFVCGHGGLGNADISGAVLFGENEISVSQLNLNWGSPRFPDPIKIYVREFKASLNSIEFSGGVFHQSEFLPVSLSVFGDFDQEEVEGIMTIGSREVGVSSGHCSFR